MQNRYSRRRIARERSHAIIAVQTPRARIYFLLLALLALTIQILVIQTHIHIPQSAGQPQIVSHQGVLERVRTRRQGLRGSGSVRTAFLVRGAAATAARAGRLSAAARADGAAAAVCVHGQLPH